MLIDNSKKDEGDKISILLANGQELIAEYVRENEDFIFVKRPRRIATNQGGAYLLPFMLTADETKTVELSKKLVISISITAQDYIPDYIASTTGIQLK